MARRSNPSDCKSLGPKCRDGDNARALWLFVIGSRRRAIRGNRGGLPADADHSEGFSFLCLHNKAIVLDGRENAIGAAVSAKGLRSKVVAGNCGRTNKRKGKTVGL